MDADNFFFFRHSVQKGLGAMRITYKIGTAALVMVIFAGGCSNKAADDAALLREESMNLRAQLDERNGALEAANSDRRELAMQNAELRRKLDDSNSRLTNLSTPTRNTGFEGISGVRSEFSDGEIMLIIESDVLFDSGKASLKSKAKSSLAQVASVLKTQYGSKEVKISGHTDSDPIKKSNWKTNYHLGAERAYSVMEFLRQKGVDLDRMHIASYGPSKPMGNKISSRRVEIVVVLGT